MDIHCSRYPLVNVDVPHTAQHVHILDFKMGSIIELPFRDSEESVMRFA